MKYDFGDYCFVSLKSINTSRLLFILLSVNINYTYYFASMPNHLFFCNS